MISFPASSFASRQPLLKFGSQRDLSDEEQARLRELLKKGAKGLENGMNARVAAGNAAWEEAEREKLDGNYADSRESHLSAPNTLASLPNRALSSDLKARILADVPGMPGHHSVSALSGILRAAKSWEAAIELPQFRNLKQWLSEEKIKAYLRESGLPGVPES